MTHNRHTHRATQYYAWQTKFATQYQAWQTQLNNYSELKNGYVILPGSTACGVGDGIDTGKRAEIIGKMRLVVVSTTECQLRQRQVLSVVQSPHGSLKAANTAPLYRGDSDMFSEHL